ncbi:MAG: sugar transferase [Paludibacter sp.]|nr:sugar transferase [Paludibacter sp.]
MKIFYRPALYYLFIDLLILLLSFYVVLDWFPLTTNTPFHKYSIATILYTVTWLLVSYSLKRYKPLRRQSYKRTTLKLFYTTLILFLFFLFLLHNFFKPYSGFVLLSVSLGIFIVQYIFHSIYFAFRFAVEYNEITIDQQPERINAKLKTAEPLNDESYNQLCTTIQNNSRNCVLRFLQKNIDLRSGNTLVFVETTPDNLMMSPKYQYSTIVQLERLNNMRGVNHKLSIINEKLPDNGLFVCCFESKSTRKIRLLKAYPAGINYIIYSFDFIYKRIMPKIFVLRKMYYFLSKGKNRIFSKTEVFGRLYCLGFEVVKERKVDNLTYVFAKRVKQPETTYKRIYGPLIRLRRYGKNAKLFEVYKFRTMHPYSEFLQAYIHEHNSLKKGGKFNKDIRITSIGYFMRKYWLDELPMIFNLLKGDMKLVGVRPLSTHYFSLYSKELQELRIQFKPGLLPPFYADMPQTLDEIQQSEMKYLRECKSKGLISTDVQYFFKILKNILFRKARSS